MIVPLTAQQTMDLVGPGFVTTFQTEMDAIMLPLRKHIALGRPLSMGKELWEYVVADSIPGAVWNGAGHSLIDVMITHTTELTPNHQHTFVPIFTIIWKSCCIWCWFISTCHYFIKIHFSKTSCCAL